LNATRTAQPGCIAERSAHGSQQPRRAARAAPLEEFLSQNRLITVNTNPEWDLIVRCRAGSAAAFEPLVRGHEARGLALAEALLGDADEAADAVQDAFVKAYRSLDRLREGSDFGAWFRAILRNHCLDRLRSRPRRSHVSLEAAHIDAHRWSEPTGSAILERTQLAAAVRAALARISPEHRQILTLKEIEGLSYADIARVTGLPAGSVASRLYHARAALRRAVTAAGLEWERSGT
jgi:RNA polymerase sigma-70 factor, ECF subfamily